MPQRFYTMNRVLSSHPLYTRLEALLDSRYDEARDIYLGWGYKASGRWAQAKTGNKTKEADGPLCLLLEDAFVRSLFPGYTDLLIYGIVADSSGIYYDFQGKSDLIQVLNGTPPPDHWADAVEPDELRETLALFRKIASSKYNCFLTLSPEALAGYKMGVLVVDQAKGDASLEYGGIEDSDFGRMLNDAIEENPGVPVYVRAHPDHIHRSKHSCFSEQSLTHPRIHILPPSISPRDCFQFCETVYVGTSLLGMEALIHGKKVCTYGWPFYSGWGLTEDRSSFEKPPRKKELSIEQLFEASYMRYCLYFHPESQQPCTLKEILLHLRFQQQRIGNIPGKIVFSNCTPWAKRVVGTYLYPKGVKILKSQNTGQPCGGTALTWGAQVTDVASKIIRVEDGFLRSKGLGANFHIPLSLVFDDTGIYYDARSSSRLENGLNTSSYSEDQLSEARELMEFLCSHKITKYQLGVEEVALPAESVGKRVILVPGQVDSDASITYGSPKLKNNRELLEEVRRQHPDAYICYKPHPDLLSGARPDKPLWPGIENQVDYLVEQGDIISWIEVVDEVHTLTSTVGFEALMRNKPVFTYGLPFYAGWGLTQDWLYCERRTATRTLEELVYAVLIEYPTYLNPKTGEYTTALNAAKLLADPDFSHDARPLYIRMLGPLKRVYNRFMRRR